MIYKTANEGYVFLSLSTMTYLLPWQSHWKAKNRKGACRKTKRQSYHIKDNGKVSIVYDIYQQGSTFNII